MKRKLCVVAVAAVAAWGLKWHYSNARADDLSWILAPTARLVGAATGTTFAWEAGEGYLSRDRLFLIEKSCAGINFMIAAFGMLVIALVHRARSGRAAASVLCVSLAASYSAAVLVNTIRIATAMSLPAYPSALSAFSAADIHRIEGVTVYFGGLVLLHELARRADRALAMSHRR